MPLPKEKNKDYFTYAQYKGWPEEERWEIIDGQAYDMSPAPGTTHQEISVEITRQIANYLIDKPCKVFAAPYDVFLPEDGETEDETSTIVQPDITVFCDLSKLSERGYTGPPDIVIEILSPSNASWDLIKKLALYERKGVKEYWIIHPSDKIVWKYVLAKESYGKPFIYDEKNTPSFDLFPDFKLNLRKVFGLPENQVETVKEGPYPSSARKKSSRKSKQQ
ncbi:MAG: Uma2 family endonuclease [Spirochaetia bacterium]|nr:Uma2 family endonuclease [Spirochaetia bacterium]